MRPIIRQGRYHYEDLANHVYRLVYGGLAALSEISLPGVKIQTCAPYLRPSFPFKKGNEIQYIIYYIYVEEFADIRRPKNSSFCGQCVTNFAANWPAAD
jgi:hypothetical protein